MNVIELEHGSVIHASENETTVLMFFTLTCSTVGLVLSGAALMLLFLTAYLFSEWRQNYKNQLLIQFMTSRFIYTFVRYVYDIKNVFSLCIKDCVIYLDVLAMVYTEMVLVSWMFVFTRHMYESLVKVFAVDVSKVTRVSLLTWIVPGAISLLLHLVFTIQNNRDFTFFFFYIVLFKWPLLITNAVLLILVLKSILKTNVSKTENNTRIILAMVLLIFMFCFQQILLDSLKIMYIVLLHQYNLSSYLLIMSNILLFFHCAFSIIFWVFGNANTRKLWKSYFKRSTSTNSTNSTYSTNNAVEEQISTTDKTVNK